MTFSYRTTIVLTVLLLAASFGTVAIGPNDSTATATSTEPPTRALATDRCVLIEFFTGTWCIPCAPADEGLDQIAEAYPGTDVAILEYHCWQSDDPGGVSYDPFAIDEVYDIATSYGITATPVAVLDGETIVDEPAATSGSDADRWYDALSAAVDTRLQTAGAASITMTLTETGSTMSITGTITARQALAAGDAYTIKGAVFEDEVDYDATNGVSVHRYTVRELLDPVALGALADGGTESYQASVSIDSSWDASKLGVVLFVQSNADPAATTHPVIQSASALLHGTPGGDDTGDGDDGTGDPSSVLIISDITTTPETPTAATNTITVTAKVVSNYNIESVKLQYCDDTQCFMPMEMTKISGDTYEYEFSDWGDTEYLKFNITAKDSSGTHKTSNTITITIDGGGGGGDAKDEGNDSPGFELVVAGIALIVVASIAYAHRRR